MTPNQINIEKQYGNFEQDEIEKLEKRLKSLQANTSNKKNNNRQDETDESNDSVAGEAVKSVYMKRGEIDPIDELVHKFLLETEKTEKKKNSDDVVSLNVL